MKQRNIIMILITSLVLLLSLRSSAKPLRTYDETWKTLSKHPIPEWFKDAKFGIYAHWGVYCVPAFGNEWYPRNMYRKGSKEYKHHIEKYGDQSKFGYKDFIPMFTAKKFDAEKWADLYAKAGVKFAGPVAEHHDGFSMWASKVNRWNSADMGPKRDITGELVKALRKRGIKIITSFHHGYNIEGYYPKIKGCDTSDPKYGDLYGNFSDPKVAYDRWLKKLEEVIDAYRPDQIWFDFGLGKIPDLYKRKMAAYYYNKEAVWGKQVIITRKDHFLPEGVGALDIERGKMAKPAPFVWQTDDSIAINSWCWVTNLMVKPTDELVHELIDIVSKNGVLLLNVCPKADGTFPPEEVKLLTNIGNWLKINGEAIYATRPWIIHGEGVNLYDKGRGFSHNKKAPVIFTGRDIRYTQSKDKKSLFAIALGWPGKELVLQSPRVTKCSPGASVQMLGCKENLKYKIDNSGQISVTVPEKRPCDFAYSFKFTGMTFKIDPFSLPGAVTLDPSKAVLDGDTINTEEKTKGIVNIGFWDNPKESVHWLARIEKTGEYMVRGKFSAASGASALKLECNGKTVSFKIPRTGSWDNTVTRIATGRIVFHHPGIYHVVLRAADPGNWKAVNAWKLQLAITN